ncbi:hypothetical protein HYPSUDRAFT_208702 [Hypholoma sublateritium FD-334 SS-4]|uniref:Uncharacterized protein n=1 Tax=Hypholoma sublateritium (strain FD-334 SS-4) TaxID=945553 RepID=A0A0D2NCV2_HYPSF|nr:hypothetical protein HYPSUDRAFT_208702 [Hypholoma sublateritium FD-334 SS-4]
MREELWRRRRAAGNGHGPRQRMLDASFRTPALEGGAATVLMIESSQGEGRRYGELLRARGGKRLRRGRGRGREERWAAQTGAVRGVVDDGMRASGLWQYSTSACVLTRRVPIAQRTLLCGAKRALAAAARMPRAPGRPTFSARRRCPPDRPLGVRIPETQRAHCASYSAGMSSRRITHALCAEYLRRPARARWSALSTVRSH